MKKLKIVFVTNNDNRPFWGTEDEALGGAWFVHLSIAKELASYGHKVYSFQNTPSEDPQGRMVDGVKMVHRKWLKEFLAQGHVDIFIGERDMPIVRLKFDIGVVMYHIHNTGQAEHPGDLAQWLNTGAVDKVICVSEWHRSITKLPKDKIYVIPNGTHYYKPKGAKKKNRIIWASNPTRGLHLLATEIFPSVKKKIPSAELHVAGGFGIYNNSPGEADKKNKVSYGYLKGMKGVKYHGPLNQKDLAQFFHEGSLLVYPLTNRSETGSIVTVQAMTYLTPVIGLYDCVFPELVGRDEDPNGRGYLIFKESRHDYDLWARIIVHALKKRETYKRLQANCRKWRDAYNWTNIVRKVEADFRRWCE
jgi:glycosyltransferase involved in cell wall biosynthesis